MNDGIRRILCLILCVLSAAGAVASSDYAHHGGFWAYQTFALGVMAVIFLIIALLGNESNASAGRTGDVTVNIHPQAYVHPQHQPQHAPIQHHQPAGVSMETVQHLLDRQASAIRSENHHQANEIGAALKGIYHLIERQNSHAPALSDNRSVPIDIGYVDRGRLQPARERASIVGGGLRLLAKPVKKMFTG